MTRPLDRLLAEDRYVRSLAQALLADAEEVEQRTWLRALQHGGDGIRQPRSWLRKVVRNVARDLKRDARRRELHERQAAREPVVPSSAELAEREESRRVLIGAIDELPNGSRTAIWLRYFEGLPPRAIAARLGVPVTTVWTQLRRGLAALRKRLEEERDWRALLAPLVAWPIPAPATSTSTISVAAQSLWLPLLFMTTKTKFVAAAAALLVFLGVRMALPEAAPNLVSESPAAPPGRALAAAPTQASELVPTVPAARSERPTDEATQDDARKAPRLHRSRVVLRGRCVDSTGRPLPEVHVRLHGWTANQVREDAYRRDHGQLEWSDPEPLVTDADGQFRFAFWPPPPMQFSIEWTTSDHAPLIARWTQLQPGAVVDMGDVVLERGTLVSGWLEGADGRRLGVRDPKAMLTLEWAATGGRPDGRPLPLFSMRAQVAADGSFEFPRRFAARLWQPRLRADIELVDPQRKVDVRAPSTQLRLVARSTAELPTLSGVVVDPSGRPVGGAHVFALASLGSPAYSDRDGRFELRAQSRSAPDQSVGLRATKSGYETFESSETYAWGARGIRLVLVPGQELEVRVVRAGDGQPVEAFGARLEPAQPSGFASTYDEVQGGWEHPGGILRLPGILPGRHRLSIEPLSTSGLVETAKIVEVGEGTPDLVTFQLPVAVRQAVELRNPAGEPIAGSTVECIDPLGEAIGPSTMVRRRDRIAFPRAGQLLDEAATDANGRAIVEGPPGQKLVLRIRGQHEPVLRHDVVLSDSSLRMTAAEGATLLVRARPVSVVGGWQRIGNGERQPEVRLVRSREGRTEWLPSMDKPGVPLDEHGNATLVGVPAGKWNARLSYPVHANRGSTIRIRPQLELRSGQTETRVVDVKHYRLGRLRAHVLVDAEPARGNLRIQRDLLSRDSAGHPHPQVLWVALDSDGFADREIPLGTWKTELHLDIAGGRCVLPMRSVQIVPEQTTEVILHAEVGRVRMRLLGPDGQPAARVTVLATIQVEGSGTQGVTNTVQTGQTDEEGLLEWVGRPGDYTLEARVRSLGEARRYEQHLQEISAKLGASGSSNGFQAEVAKTVVPIGTMRLSSGPQDPVVIQLPAEWDR